MRGNLRLDKSSRGLGLCQIRALAERSETDGESQVGEYLRGEARLGKSEMTRIRMALQKRKRQMSESSD